MSAVGDALIERADWDGLFAVATRFGERRLLVRLVTAAWEELLAEGRVATVSNWLDRPMSSTPDLRCSTSWKLRSLARGSVRPSREIGLSGS